MSTARVAVAAIAGILLYASLLVAPYGYYAAPVIAGAVVGALLPRRGGAAAGIGLLAGLAGWVLLLGFINGLQALSLALGIGGPAPLAVAVLYHLLTPMLVAYLASRPWTTQAPRESGAEAGEGS